MPDDVPDADIHGYSFNDLPLSISGVSPPSSGYASGAGSPRVSCAGVVPSMDALDGGFDPQEQEQEEEEDAVVVTLVPAAAFHKPAAGVHHHHHHHAPPRRHASDVDFVRMAARRGGVAATAGVGAATTAAAADMAVPGRSLLEQVVVSLWEDRADRGMFRWVRREVWCARRDVGRGMARRGVVSDVVCFVDWVGDGRRL